MGMRASTSSWRTESVLLAARALACLQTISNRPLPGSGTSYTQRAARGGSRSIAPTRGSRAIPRSSVRNPPPEEHELEAVERQAHEDQGE